MDIDPISPFHSTLLYKARLFLFTIVAVGLVFGVIFYGLYQRGQSQNKKTQEYAKNVQEGKKDIRKLNAEAVNKLEQAVAGAPTIGDESLAKIDLGVAYAFFSQDPLKGLAVLKEVAANTEYHGFSRGRAMLKILSTFIVQRMDLEFAKNNIFTGPAPWDSFIEGSKDVEDAARKAYEWVLQFGETPSANYYIASWYAMRLLEEKISKPSLSPEIRNGYRDKFISYMGQAENWLPDMLAAPNLELYEKVEILSNHGNAHALLYVLEGKEGEKKIAELAYKQAMNMLTTFSDAGYAPVFEESYRRSVQFNYAKLLSHDAVINKKKDLKNKIHELLLPIIEVKNQQVDMIVMLTNISKLPKNHAQYWLILHIAEVDPEFASFLKNLGWSL